MDSILFIILLQNYKYILTVNQTELFYTICLTLLPGIGNVRGKKLITVCGSAEAVFNENKKTLSKIPGFGTFTVQDISLLNVSKNAEEEINIIEKYKIIPLLFNSPLYPDRLKHCEDGPLLLYSKGNTNFNFPKVIGIVGTRKATSYGKKYCTEIVKQLASPDILIVSGLALGIDGCAHEAAIENNITTVGILAHGLNIIYPPSHKQLAIQMLKNGALITEFSFYTKPDKENFPQRNRIIAGMSDAILVIETGLKGGALITAEFANSYNRDVFALPGRVNDFYSQGCNRLIRNNKAALVESADDIKYIMGWNDNKSNNIKNIQQDIPINLNDDEKQIVDLLQINGESSIDFICLSCGMTNSKIASILLNLEFQGIVKSLPGNRFILN
jgi:DNA processing protein